MTLSRDAAWQLLTEWTQGESLRKHALAVEAAVRGYARQQGANEEEWGVVALALGAGIIATVIPAWRAYRQDVAATLADG